tara:strand:+ start:205 stop:678 length:474 start_codon:yes stop_codon:yes gene_type:complete
MVKSASFFSRFSLAFLIILISGCTGIFQNRKPFNLSLECNTIKTDLGSTKVIIKNGRFDSRLIGQWLKNNDKDSTVYTICNSNGEIWIKKKNCLDCPPFILSNYISNYGTLTGNSKYSENNAETSFITITLNDPETLNEQWILESGYGPFTHTYKKR